MCKARELANTTSTVSVMANACWLIEKHASWGKARAGMAYSPLRSLGWTWNGEKIEGPVVPKPKKVTLRNRMGSSSHNVCEPCDKACERCLWILEIPHPVPDSEDFT